MTGPWCRRVAAVDHAIGTDRTTCRETKIPRESVRRYHHDRYTVFVCSGRSLQTAMCRVCVCVLLLIGWGGGSSCLSDSGARAVYTRSIQVLLQALPSLSRWSISPQQRDSLSQYDLVTNVLQAIQSAGTSLVVWLAWRGETVRPHFMCLCTIID
jgi:hypothetical protein